MEQLDTKIISEVTMLGNVVKKDESEESLNRKFIGANTFPVTIGHLKERCIVPSYADNERTISHQEFIDIIGQAATLAFPNESISMPVIRASHPIRGRVPSAILKPVKELREDEQTTFYERLAFYYELPGITEDVNGNPLSLSIGGIRAYNLENLHSKKNYERFKIWIGWRNHVCFNMAVSTDGYKDDLRVRTIAELLNQSLQLFGSFDMQKELSTLENLSEYSLSERQFALLVGRLRMYQFLKPAEREGIPQLYLGDSQINHVIKGYFLDRHFKHDLLGCLDLWRFYNLLTSANKSSYLDNWMDRNVNALSFTSILLEALKTGKQNWFLDGH